MSRIAVVTPVPVPNVDGGNERHWRSLTAALVQAGHEVDLVAIDTPESSLIEVVQSYRRFVQLDLGSFDVVVSGKYPSFMVRHPRHIRHLNHLLRGLYDRYDTSLGFEIPADLGRGLDERRDDAERLIAWVTELVEGDPQNRSFDYPGPFARAVVHALDRIGRDGLQTEAAVSEVVAQRLDYVDPSRPISIVPPLGDFAALPAGDSSRLDSDDEKAVFLTFGRMDRIKRFDLVIRGFASARVHGAELVVAGNGPQKQAIADLASRTPGVRMAGWLTDDELHEAITRSRAVILAPVDEDFGLVAAEAFSVGRPVITTTDSGGIAEQVENGTSGLIVPPHRILLGRAIRRLANDADEADRMGRNGLDQQRESSWDPMIRLVDRSLDPAAGQRPRLLMLSTFDAEPVRHGGHRRLRGLATALTGDFEVVVLALSNAHLGIRRRRFADGVCQVSVGRSETHLRADFRMASVVGMPVDDVACHRLWPSSPEFSVALSEELESADLVMLAHPYLASALPELLETPVIYDAHNVEQDLKAEIYDLAPGKSWLGEAVRESEQMALQRASVVIASALEDSDRLAELGATKTIVVPNGIVGATRRSTAEKAEAHTRFLADHSGVDPRRPIAVFMGSNHPPNREAAAIVVALALDLPDIEFVIAGSVDVDSDIPNNMTVVGAFPETAHRRMLAMADVALNPMLAGSGTNLKLIEAMAVGVPVLSTAIGARGLSRSGDLVKLADISEFGPQLLSMLSEPPSNAEIAASVEYSASRSWQRVVEPLVTTIEELL